MKNLVLAISLLSCSMVGCVGTQTTTTTTQKPSDAMNTSMKLNGSWELADIPGARVSVAGMYPNKKPIITIDVNDNKFVGNTSCNNFSGLLVVYGNKVSFNKSMAMTKMACDGEGETTFVDALKKIDTFTINGDNTLSLNAAGIETLRLVKVVKQ